MIWNVVGTLNPGVGRVFETTVHWAVRIADDKIKLISTQQEGAGVNLVWWRQPGERWEVVLVKVGPKKYRTYSAQREDGKKIAAKDGFVVMPPSDTKFDQMPTDWIRGDKETPVFENCTN
jgi:hypothetical protein